MKVKLAKHAGFCWGVRRAVNMVLEAVHRGKPNLFTYGPLIHNPQVIGLLKDLGVGIITNPSEVTSNTNLFIRSHGVSPQEREELRSRGATIHDATCPLVEVVQKTIGRFSQAGYRTIIVGEPGHPEVSALLGFAQGKGIAVSRKDQVESSPPWERVCVVAQTTQERKTFWELAQMAKTKYQICTVFDTICPATLKRQDGVRKILPKVEAIVVVGGRNSANTARLAQISRSLGKLTLQVETEEEIKREKLGKLRTIGITAGASTPNWMIQRVVEKVENLDREGGLRGLFFRGIRFLIRSNLYLAFGVACFSYAVSHLQGMEPRLAFPLVASGYVFSMHLFNHYTDPSPATFNEPYRISFYRRHKGTLLGLAFIALAGTLALSLNLGLLPFLLLAFISLTGAIYRLKIIPPTWSLFPYRRLVDIPGSKDLFLALAWSLVIAALQGLSRGNNLSPAFGVAFGFTFILSLVRSSLFSLKDIQGDRIVGRETLPIILGKRKTKLLLIVILTGLTLILPLSWIWGWTSSLGLWLLLPVAYAYFYLFLYHRRVIFQGILSEAVVDTDFILSGATAYLWSVVH